MKTVCARTKVYLQGWEVNVYKRWLLQHVHVCSTVTANAGSKHSKCREHKKSLREPYLVNGETASLVECYILL